MTTRTSSATSSPSYWIGRLEQSTARLALRSTITPTVRGDRTVEEHSDPTVQVQGR